MTLQSFRRSYQIAPILLVNGIAANAPNKGQMTILALTEGNEQANYADVNDYFAQFEPLPGGTLVDFSPAEYPFASLNMAANAMLQQALKISLKMLCPARTGQNNYDSIQSKITLIQQQLTAHILAGGTFTVATPATIYDNCLLTTVRDISNAGDKKVQGVFQWDFIKPLITPQQAEAAYNNLYAKMQSGLPVPNPPTNSGPSAAIGNATANQPTPSGPASATGPN